MLTYIVSNELLFRPEYSYMLFHAHTEGSGQPPGTSQTPEDAQAFMRNYGFESRCMQMPGEPSTLLMR